MNWRVSHRTLSALVMSLAVIAGCGEREGMRPGQQTSTPLVLVSKPQLRTVTDYAYFTGRTDAVNSVDIRARVTGYLVKMPFKEGSEVKEGALLFEIDPRPYQATLDSQLGQVKLNEAQLKLARADLARAQEIAKTPGAISQQDLDKYAASEAEGEAAVAAAKANAENARLNLEFCQVTSPIAGEVGRYFYTIGNLVTQDQTLLTTVVSVDPMYAYFDVDERTMLQIQVLIREGKFNSAKNDDNVPVELGLANEADEYPHKAVVNFVNNQLDPSTGTLQVRGTFPNPLIKPGAPRLFKPGMFVRVRTPLGHPHPSLVVPQAAIGADQGRRYMLVVNDKNVVQYRPVNLGPQQPAGMQVIDPVKIVIDGNSFRSPNPGETGIDSVTADDTIVVSGLQRIRPGVTVKTQAADGTTP